jgi:ribosomal protein S18 acetylase RimI-like enzyme
VAFTFRRFREGDVEAVKEIDWHSFWPDDQYDDAYYGKFASDGDLRAFVAVSDSGETAGYALLDTGVSPARLRSLAVHPNYRGAGCAATIIREVLSEFPGNIDLFVDPENVHAIRLYERLGFTFVTDSEEMPARRRMARRVP